MKDPRVGFGTADEVVTDSNLDFNLNSLQASIEQLFSGAENDSLQTLTEKTQNRIKYLQYLQEQHDDLLLQFLKDRVALENEYNKLYEPLYSKRYAIVNGQLEVETVADVENDPDQGVPNFWLTAMKRNSVLAGEITPKDEEVLQFLTDIRFQNFSDRTGFELEFMFEPNAFFKNTVLSKAVLFGEDCKPKSPPTVIEWYDGKWTQKSFFNFFKPPKVLEDGDLENDSENLDLLDQLDQDCAIGYRVVYTPREANSSAHQFAKAGLNDGPDKIWFMCEPVWVSKLLEVDRLGLSVSYLIHDFTGQNNTPCRLVVYGEALKRERCKMKKGGCP